MEPELYLQIHLDILSLYIMCALPLKLIFISFFYPKNVECKILQLQRTAHQNKTNYGRRHIEGNMDTDNRDETWRERQRDMNDWREHT